MNPKKAEQMEAISTKESAAEFDRTLDQILGAEDEIVPSSGFLASVMERVEEEAAAIVAPASIPFPWKRALPGMLFAIVVLGWGGWEMVRISLVAGPAMRLPELPANAFKMLEPVAWIAAALACSLLSWLLANRLVRKSGLL